MWSDADLYRRGAETLVASWEEYARGAGGASVRRSPGVAAAVFPKEPERAVYNNALLQRELTSLERADALHAMEATYAAAGVTRFAAWGHESDKPMRADIERRGYTLDTWTRAMGIALDDVRLSRPDVELGPPDWSRVPAHPRAARRTSSAEPIRPPTTYSSLASATRTSRPRWLSISPAIAAYTT